MKLAAAMFALVISLSVEANDNRPLFYDHAAIQSLQSEGLKVPADGTYQVWIWGKGPKLSISIGESNFAANSSRFGWHHVGDVKLAQDQSVPVSAPANSSLEDVTNVPGYLALSADPNFDAKRTPLGALRTLYDGSGFKPAKSKDEWLKRRDSLRRQIEIATGMWPPLPKADLNPQVYGKQLRDGYSVEKVVLETFPGFYLSGNLYRPAPWVPAQGVEPDVKARRDAWEKTRSAEKKPGILSPHGHWRDGRFEPEVQKRAKHLARMGAVVFSYDMVGRADSTPFGHTFLDTPIELMGFSLLALQTWNSIRAMDFITSLPDIDLDRIACTGASGGGTQTFVLAAIDDRLKVAAPVVMVSQDMQGGCSCENASGLRIGTDNSEIAALFAPKPQVFVSARDWTWEFMTKGFPEVQSTYALFGSSDQVESDVYDFPHNYNQTSRERVYAFFAKHLFGIDPELSKELPLEADAPATISTWDAEHPRPENAVDVKGLKQHLANVVAEQSLRFRPTSKETWASTREELAGALAHRLALDPIQPDQLIERTGAKIETHGYRATWVRIGTGPSPRISGVLYEAAESPKALTLVVRPEGTAALAFPDNELDPLTASLLKQGHTVLAIDTFATGKNTTPFLRAATSEISHFTCYNRSTVAERVQDVVTAMNYLRGRAGEKPVNVVGVGASGPVVLIARTQVPFVHRTVVDANQFEYRTDAELPADQVLPGIVRLGGLRAIGSLAAPGHLLVHNTGERFETGWMEEAYKIQGAERNLTVARMAISTDQVVSALNE